MADEQMQTMAEEQALLRWLVSTSKVKERQKILKMIPVGSIELVFSVEPIKIMYKAIRAFMDRYNEPPDLLAFDTYLPSDPDYAKWVGTASPVNLIKFRHIKEETFTSSEKLHTFWQEKAMQIVAKILLQIHAQSLMDKMDSDNVDTLKVFDEHIKEINKVKQELDFINSADTETRLSYLFEEDVTDEEFTSLAAIPTIFSGIFLYKTGLTVLAAPAKMGKTRISVSIAFDLFKKGFSVFVADFENGLSETRCRFFQQIIADAYGWRVPLLAFYAGQVADFFNLPPDWIELERKQSYDSGTCGVEVRYEEKVENGEIVYVPSISAKKAIRYGAMLENSEDWENLDCPIGFISVSQMAKEGMLICKEKYPGGQIRIKYCPGASVDDISATLTEWKENPSDTFFKNPKRFLMVDWMRLVAAAKGKEAQVWQKSRNNYAAIKNIQITFGMYPLVIDGVSNPELCSEEVVNPDKVKMTDSNAVDYDAACVAILVTSQTERASGTGRLYLKSSRNSKSGRESVMYLKHDSKYVATQQISEDEYYELNPTINLSADGAAKAGVSSDEVAAFKNFAKRKKPIDSDEL